MKVTGEVAFGERRDVRIEPTVVLPEGGVFISTHASGDGLHLDREGAYNLIVAVAKHAELDAVVTNGSGSGLYIVSPVKKPAVDQAKLDEFRKAWKTLNTAEQEALRKVMSE